MLKGKRYDKLKRTLSKRPDVSDVRLDEDFIPPHKQSGFVPYDAIIDLETPVYGGEDEWDKDSVTAMLHSTGIRFDEVVSVEESSSDSDQMAFISLQSSEEAFKR